MNQLTSIIKSIIHDSGPMTFEKFMELSLYHPQYGYYASGKTRIGKKGDYYTSPCVHPAFGEIICRFICRAYEVMDIPNFTVVEIGAGKGFLALDILDSLKRYKGELYESISYVIIELSQHQLKEEKTTLKKHLNKIKWVNSLSNLESESIFGVLISNELVDSLPFHRARFKDGELHEIFVSLQDREFIETLGEPSTGALKNYFDGYNLKFEEEQELEVNLNAKKLLSDVARVLAKGLILTIDYGYLAPDLYNPSRMKGTFMCYYRHTTNENPFINIGEQDITAHVDFTNLIRAGQSFNLKTSKYSTQGQFLVDWGILDILERYSCEKEFPDFFSQKERLAIKNLLLPNMMGDKFKVLIQEKKIIYKDQTFYPESPFKITFQDSTDIKGE